MVMQWMQGSGTTLVLIPLW